MSDSKCFHLLDDAIAAASGGGGSSKKQLLMYDARTFVTSQSAFPNGKVEVEKYLNQADVRAALHTTSTPQKYTECADPPYNALAHQDGKSALKELQEVITDESGVKVLVYSGQYDIICNHLGNERMLEHIEWKDRENWLLSNNYPYILDNTPVGYLKSYKNLGFMVVLNAGHMVRE